MTLEIDSLLHERYRIKEELGHGGMGAVYRAVDENLGVEVAIKENLFSTPEAERQFRREATLLAGLRHPHLPRVTDHFVIAERGQYLVMDFIPGEDARARLERGGPLSEAEVTRWGREILDALYYLHSRMPPVIHRDIKPGNIKIMPDGRAVLVDFGLAKEHDTTQSTTVGAKALTPGYAPPEQYGLGRTDSRTDIYSLSATLYTLLTNQMPTDSIERAMGQKTLVPLRELKPEISAQMAAALEKALEVKPEDRYDSAAEFAAALPVPARAEQPAAPATTPAPTVQPATQVGQPPSGATRPVPLRRAWAGPALIIGLVVILGGGGAGLWASGALGNIFPGLGAAPAASATPPPTAAPTQTAPAPTSAPTQTPPPPVDTDTPAPAATATESVPPTATTVADTATPAATPRGGGQGQLAYASDEAGAPQIFVINVDGSGKQQLTFIPDGACQPVWSPDGKEILFVSPCRGKDDQYPRGALYLMGADGSNVRLHLSQVGGVYDADWSDTGIAYTYLENNQPRLWVAGPDGSGTRQLSAGRSADMQASWSPGDDKLVFMNTSRAGSPTLYWMFKDGTFNGAQPDQVTRDQRAMSPAWAPAGDLVAYVVDQQIWMVKWDARGFGPLQLTIKGPNADPAWSPDGQWLTFESWRDAANHDIYIMAANGGLQTRLTTGPAAEYQPAWRP